MKTLWVHPFNGIAGDMMLGALIDAGADIDAIRESLASLSVDDWELHASPTMRNGLSATNVTVKANEGHVHRTAGDIISLIDSSNLPARVVERATAVFTALATAEGAVHNRPPESVHFHEVGGIDAIVDVVGVCVALELLEIDTVAVAPIAVGHGTVNSAHGLIPHPAPATVRLLEGLPVAGIDIGIELTTPTGAALARVLGSSYGPMPSMTIEASGFGAGDAEPDSIPNLLHVILGEATDISEDTLVQLDTNVDDATAEILAHSIQTLLDAGALDAWITPIVMKKGRHAHTVSVLCTVATSGDVGARLLSETGSIGYRTTMLDRTSAVRRTDVVQVDGHDIRVKVTAHRAKAEFDDVASVAAKLNQPARQVAFEAERIWAEQQPD